MKRESLFLCLASLAAGCLVGWIIPLRVSGEWLKESEAKNEVAARRASVELANGGVANPAANTAANSQSSASAADLEAGFLRLWQIANQAGDKSIDRELQAIMKLAMVDPYRAVALAMKLTGPNAQELVVRLIKSMKTTSQHALRALLENPKWNNNWQVVNAIFENLAAVDPRMAWEEATKDGRTFGSDVIYTVVTEWGLRAPMDAVAYASSIADRDLRKRFSDVVFGRWMQSKTDDFLAWFRSLPDPAAWSDVIPWQMVEVKTKEQFLALAAVSPAQLANPQFDGQSPFDGFFKQPARKDDYLAWASSIPDEAKRTTALTSLAKAMLNWNPEDALPLLSAVTDANTRTQITSAAAAWRTLNSPAEGVAFADSLEGNARGLALRSVISTWAESDPAAAAAFIVTRPQDFGFDGTQTGELRDQMDRVVSKWAKHDPLAAASFALAQKEAGVTAGIAQNNNYGLRSAMSTWVNQDAYAASAWVTNMEPGRARDIAADALAGAAMNLEPASALGWAMSIGDAEMRETSVRDCVTSWTWRDAKSAGEWVKTAPIGEPLRAELTTVVTKRLGVPGPTSSMGYVDKTVFQ